MNPPCHPLRETTRNASRPERARGAPARWFKHPAALALLPIILYVAAINPYFLPANYDDTVYYFGAVSLADEGTFKLHGKHIVDWPPGLSTLLAIPFALGLQSVVIAKLCVVLCAAVALLLCWRLFQAERREHTMVILWIFALLPAAYMMGTRIMAEWPFIMLSMLFLLALAQLRTGKPSMALALGCGVILGAAALTKFIGVLLGAAVVAQMIGRLRQGVAVRNWRILTAEPLVAFVGATIFLLWKAKLKWQAELGTAAASDYYQSGWIAERFNNIDVVSVFQKIGELFFHAETVSRFLGVHGFAVQLFLALPGIIVLIGMAQLFRSRQVRSSDWYVLSVLLLFSTLGDNQQIRYLLPIAPFLIHYFLLGCKRLWQFVPKNTRATSLAFRGLTAAWLLFLAGSVSYLLFAGNLSRTHTGLLYFASPTPESFYRGYWLEFYRVCQRIKADRRAEKVAVIGGDEKYLNAFADRDPLQFHPAERFDYVLILDGTSLSENRKTALQLAEVTQAGAITLYRQQSSDGPVASRE